MTHKNDHHKNDHHKRRSPCCVAEALRFLRANGIEPLFDTHLWPETPERVETDPAIIAERARQVAAGQTIHHPWIALRCRVVTDPANPVICGRPRSEHIGWRQP